jgi:2-keto-3-deoxy-galactonokinase
MQVTNNAEGPRGLNALIKGKPQTIVLERGESRDVVLADESCPVFAGMVRSRDFLVEQPKAAGPAPAVALNEDRAPTAIADDKTDAVEADKSSDRVGNSGDFKKK